MAAPLAMTNEGLVSQYVKFLLCLALDVVAPDIAKQVGERAS